MMRVLIEGKVWCYYPLQDQEIHEQVIKQSTIFLTFGATGDLSQLPPTQEAVKEAYRSSHPQSVEEYGENHLGQIAGILRRFAHEIEIHDCVVYPSSVQLDDPDAGAIHIGIIDGTYQYDEEYVIHYRYVTWLTKFERSEFSSEALKGIGGANTALFRIRSKVFLNELDEKLNKLFPDEEANEP